MEIKIEDLTTMDLQGEGAFDNVMTAMQTRLDREFTKNRIKGPDYAKVYLGTFEASLMNTIQFILGRQEADKKAELLVQQTITEKDKLLTAKIGRDHVAAQILQTKKQTEKLDHDIALVDKQGLKVDAETNLLVDQLITEALKRKLMSEQIDLAKQEILLKKEQVKLGRLELDLKAEEIAIAKETLKLTKVQIWTETAKTNDNPGAISPSKTVEGILGSQRTLSEAQSWVERAKVADNLSLTSAPKKVGGLMGEQINKSKQEGDLIEQKKYTEESQIRDKVSGISVTGIIGAQKGLYFRQADGFLRDAEQKLAKIYTDTMNTMIVSTDKADPGTAGLNNKQIKAVLGIAKSGITNPRPIP